MAEDRDTSSGDERSAMPPDGASSPTGASQTAGASRTERDALGEVQVPLNALWGAQTSRSLHYFAIGDERFSSTFVAALVLIKRASAVVHASTGRLDGALSDAILAACDDVLSGGHADAFPLSVWQTGSGTQTNMNVNEVLANLANLRLGGGLGSKAPVHPNDHVNLGQSSNDVFPSAMHVAAVRMASQRLLPALRELSETLRTKAEQYSTLVKIGRTHLQDATPLTLGQAISGWVTQVELATTAVASSVEGLLPLAIGGTAVGTGLSTSDGFDALVCAELARTTGFAFRPATNKFAALAGHEPLVLHHAALRTCAIALTKLANDVRWLASGPRAGLAELRIPENEPGSSIMPGKVNPTQAEALTMVCALVLGHDVTVGYAASQGHFELNVFKPVIHHCVETSTRLLTDAVRAFDRHCARGLVADEARIGELLERSLMLVTALVPHVGYDAAARIARDAHARGLTLREAALATGLLTGEQFDVWVRPADMTRPNPP